MNETNHFFNLGYGWLCKHCSAAESERRHHESSAHPRFYREGESEAKEPTLAMLALARWTDSSRQVLACPRCKIEEPIGKP